MSPWTYLLLFFTGLAAGCIDSMAGGGGLITLPVLLNLGMPVPLALGTNKFQASFGSCSAVWHYSRAGATQPASLWRGILFTLVGALLGAWAVKSIDGALLSRAIPWLLLAIFLYTAARPQVGTQKRPARTSEALFWPVAGLLLGFYDGFFGPGTGSFWTIAIVLLLGRDFLTATAETKVMNATSNVASLAFFAIAGHVNLAAGAVMAVGQLIGTRIGTHLVLSRGAKLVRPLFLVVVSATILRLFYIAWFR